MKTFFEELFEYNNRMNQKLIEAFNQHSDKASERSVKWMNHILNAQQVWISRIDKSEEPLSPWHVHSLGYLKELNASNFARTCALLKSGDLERKLEYVNSSGKAYENTVKDILFHVINHSTYHRGQIAADFRESGIDPIVTDYIAFKR